MRLVDAAGQVLELEIVGYQFPDSESIAKSRAKAVAGGLSADRISYDTDANWLLVRGEIETKRGSWKFRDPCLETREARSLCAWLQRAATGEPSGDLDFTEPNIAFEAPSAPTSGVSVRVTVKFALEARPPWSPRDDFEQSPVEFEFRPADLVQAAADLSAELAKYPER